MRILIITRIYTALEDSIKTKSWRPRGMPAYYKLIERLNAQNDIETDAVCLGKAGHSGIVKKKIFKFDNLKIRFHVIPYVPIKIFRIFGLKIYGYLSGIVNEILHFFYCVHLALRNKYDLVYIDRANIVIGAFLALFLRKKVVMRFYGAGSLIKRMEGLKKWIKDPFKYLSYKTPFRYVICTEDGSGSRYFFAKYLNKNTPYEILLNGVDMVDTSSRNISFLRQKYDIPLNRKVILFLARLERGKGADLFIKSIAELAKINDAFTAIVVGDGPLRESLENDAERCQIAHKIIFERSIPHDRVYDYYLGADIYVSLNLLGNLCNTVLEAISAGKCIVTLKKDEIDHTDEGTEDILSGSVLVISKRRIAEELPLLLNNLLNNSGEIEAFSDKVQKLSTTLLTNWEERIDYEVGLLKKIACR